MNSLGFLNLKQIAKPRIEAEKKMAALLRKVAIDENKKGRCF